MAPAIFPCIFIPPNMGGPLKKAVEIQVLPEWAEPTLYFGKRFLRINHNILKNVTKQHNISLCLPLKMFRLLNTVILSSTCGPIFGVLFVWLFVWLFVRHRPSVRRSVGRSVGRSLID